MTTEQILAGNKLIAEFMGGKMIVVDYHGINIIQFPDGKTKDLHGLQYHSSWDWLMPVVEKIENDGVQTFDDMNITVYSRFEIRHNHVKLHWSKCHGYQLFLEVIPKWMDDSCSALSKKRIRVSIEKETSKIEAVWLAVVEFIKWYNTQNK